MQDAHDATDRDPIASGALPEQDRYDLRGGLRSGHAA
jgi:hypothetical protein